METTIDSTETGIKVLHAKRRDSLDADFIDSATIEAIAQLDGRDVARRDPVAPCRRRARRGAHQLDDIEDCYGRARRRIREANRQSLTLHHHVLYELIRSESVLAAGDVHDRYDAVADDIYRGTDRTPLGERSRRNKLDKLQESDLIEWDGENQYRRHLVVDADLCVSVCTIPSRPQWYFQV